VGHVKKDSNKNYIFIEVGGVVAHYYKCAVLNGWQKTGDDIYVPNDQSANRI
jgi:hypothetical protein